MPSLHLLGTGAAVTDPHRTTTMLALESDGRSLMVDCGGDAIQRLRLSGLDADGLEGLILTHEHPDHVSGFPLLMTRLWLLGRTRPLPVYGIDPALTMARRLLGAFDTSSWELPEIQWHPVSPESGAQVLDTKLWLISAAPGVHGVPVTALRVLHRQSGFTLGYSSDTEPSASVAGLMAGCDLIVHEATGETRGHSSIAQAVEVAQTAGAATLVLVHLPEGTHPDDVAPYQSSDLEVILGEELDRIDF